MPENINTNILKSDEGIVYIDDIQNIKNITNTFLKPNQVLVTSYNYNFYKNTNHYEGISYELYYSDNNSDIHQLTYNVCEGNGLYINDDLNLHFSIDNKTIKENDNHELYIDSNELINAYNSTIKGVLRGDNRLFYDHHLNNSGFIVANNGNLKLSNGLLISLYEIQTYYDKFDKLALEINKLAIKLDNNLDIFNIGDILYKDKNGKFTKNKDGNIPIMICVIGSNILSDGAARFIPLNNNIHKSIISINDNIYNNKSFNKIPVYDDNLNLLTKDSNIVSNDYGYISTDNKEWINNFRNPFNPKKRYYANLYTMKSDIIWYLDPDICHKSDKYSIDSKAIVTEEINFENLDIEDNTDDLCPIVEIEFSDGFKGYYMLIFNYSKDKQRYELKEASNPVTDGILLINKINNSILNISDDNKIKFYKENSIISSQEFISLYNIMQNDNTIRKIKFENDNSDNIDYKILVNEFKKDNITSSIITSEELNKDDLYETNTNQEISQKNTLSSISNNVNKTNSNEIIKYNSKTNKIYTYKLIIDPEICDRDYVYFIIQLGDNNKNVGENIYIKYDSSKGLDYVFTQYQSTSSTGYMKITAYASSEYLDKQPIDLGIIPVNGYQDSFKVVYLSKNKFSFNFNIYTIIPIKATLYKNYTLLSLNDNCTILSSNIYNEYQDAYEYSLDLNYYSIISNIEVQSENNNGDTIETITYSSINNNQETNENDDIEIYNELKTYQLQKEIETKNGTTLYIEPLINTITDKYRIIPGAIRIILKDTSKDFINNVYYAYVIIRNGLGLPTYNKYKFIKRKNYLELAENIPVYDIQNINQISIKSIEDKKGNKLNVKFNKIGKLINKINDWNELYPICQ